MKLLYSTLFLALLATGAHATDRLPTIAPENYTPEQKKAADDFMAARKGPVFGPFEPLMHSPQVALLCHVTQADAGLSGHRNWDTDCKGWDTVRR